MTTPQEKPYYVSNKALYLEYLKHFEDIKKAQENGTDLPPMPRFIAESIMKIANKYANKPNFIGYSYRDEMIADAILTCFRKYLKFNPEKSDNPFSYLTTCCHNAFLQRINSEKRESSIKARYITESIDEEFVTAQLHDEDEFKNSFVEFLRENSAFEDVIAAKKEKREKEKLQAKIDAAGPSLDTFFGEENG